MSRRSIASLPTPDARLPSETETINAHMPANTLCPALMTETMCWDSEPSLNNRFLFVSRSM
jgi:hypothetical protein